MKRVGELAGNSKTWGFATTGGTESNIQAMRVAKKENKKGSEGEKGNIVVPESAHFSFDKISDLLGVEVRKAPLNEDLKVDVGEVEGLVDDNTFAIVGIACTTEYGQVDPIEELGKIAEERGIFLHVDAAFGGFVLPFLGRRDWGFVKGVSSVSIDPHKMGFSTIPCGVLVFRENVMDRLAVDTPYLTHRSQYTLTGTRTGGSVVGAYAVMRHLGWDGYTKIVKECMRITHLMKEGCEELGLEPVIEPVCNVLCVRCDRAEDVKNELMRRNWYVSTVGEAIRMVMMPHVSERTVEEFLRELKDVLRKYK